MILVNSFYSSQPLNPLKLLSSTALFFLDAESHSIAKQLLNKISLLLKIFFNKQNVR